MGLYYLYLYLCRGINTPWFNHDTATCSLWLCLFRAEIRFLYISGQDELNLASSYLASNDLPKQGACCGCWESCSDAAADGREEEAHLTHTEN